MRLIDPKKPTNRLYVSDFVMEQMQKIPTIEAEPVNATDTNVGSKWIPVTERLPERDEKCLCRYTFGEDGKMFFYQVLDYYATDPQPHFQHTLGESKMRVTHWMPIPKPPEDGENTMDIS